MPFEWFTWGFKSWLVPLNEQKTLLLQVGRSRHFIVVLLWNGNWMWNRYQTDHHRLILPLNYCFISTSLTLMLSFFFIFFLFADNGNARRKAVDDVEDELKPLEFIWNADVEINYFAVCFCRSRWVRQHVRPLYPPLVPFVHANNHWMRFICDDTWEQIESRGLNLKVED